MARHGEPDYAIELTDVVKDFGEARVLDDLNLSVPAGAITVLIGASGAGKTVTVSHIVGLIQPTKGTVRVAGRDLARLSEGCLLYTSPSPRDGLLSRMPSSA